MPNTKILVVFYSRDGSTEALAKAIGEGAQTAGAEVRLRRAREIVGPEVMALAHGWTENAARMNALYESPTADDMVWADGVAFGTPTRFGNMCSELKAFIDSLGSVWFQGKLNGKAGGAFTSTSSLHGGNEATITSMYHPLAHLGFIIVPLGYVDPSVFRAGTPYGASAVSGQNHTPPTSVDLEVAHAQGRRLTEVASALSKAHPQ